MIHATSLNVSVKKETIIIQETAAGFKSIGSSEFIALPSDLKIQLLEHWSKELDTAQVKAAWPLCPKTCSDFFHHCIPQYRVFDAIARCCDVEEIHKAYALFKAEEAHQQAVSPPDPGSKPCKLDFGRSIYIALRRGRLESARALINYSHQLDNVFELREKDSIAKEKTTVLTEILRWGDDDLLDQCLKKHPNLWKQIFGEHDHRQSSLALTNALKKSSSNDDGIDVDIKQLKAWLDAKPALEWAVKNNDMLIHKHLNDQIILELILSPTLQIQEELTAVLGEPFIEEMLKRVVVGCKDGGREIWIKACQCSSLIQMQRVLKHIEREAFVKHTSYQNPIAMETIKKGSVEGLQQLLNHATSLGNGLALELLTQTAWVWEQDRQRKKGDALAFCVTLGAMEASQEILNRYPDIDRSYAKSVVKYFKEKNMSQAGVANATWEALMLKDTIQNSKSKGKEGKGSNEANEMDEDGDLKHLRMPKTRARL